MPDLDQEATYRQCDPSGLGNRLRGLAEQCRAGWMQGRSFTVPSEWADAELDKMLVCGMGGSAIAGNLASDLAASTGRPGVRSTPIMVVRGTEFPFSLDNRSLAIACSYSGNTGETLSLFRQAKNSGALLLAMAGGGRLAREATELGVPLLKIATEGEPRSAVGYSLMLLAAFMSNMGLAAIDDAGAEEAAASLEKTLAGLSEEVPTGKNPAKQIAISLENRTAAVYGGGLFSGMARRWKTQLNENAKAWAFFEEIPELLHNAVEAFTQPPGGGLGLSALLLRPSINDDPLAAHYNAVEKLLKDSSIPFHVARGNAGESPLAQLLDMLALGDYVSYYLAMLKGVDPSPSPNIDRSKQLLAADAGMGRQG